MSKKVNINLFDVDWSNKTLQNLSDTLDEFAGLSMDMRWRDEVRLDHIKKEPADTVRKLPERYHLNFTKRRDIGPGKLGNSAPISSIQLQQGEDFGEETAAIYVPSKKMLLVLHNQSGVGPTRMMSYLNALDPGSSRYFDYAASPRLDASVASRLTDMRNLLSVNVTATVDALQASGDPLSMPLAQATKTATAKKISLRLSANGTRKKTNFLNPVETLQFIRSMISQNDDVSVLQVKGEDPSTGASDQVIDLLKHKVKQTFKASDLIVNHHRYTEESRLRLLDRALRNWI